MNRINPVLFCFVFLSILTELGLFTSGKLWKMQSFLFHCTITHQTLIYRNQWSFWKLLILFHWVFINSKPYFVNEETAVGRKGNGAEGGGGGRSGSDVKSPKATERNITLPCLRKNSPMISWVKSGKSVSHTQRIPDSEQFLLAYFCLYGN